MKTIWKYTVALKDVQEITMKKEARILTLHKQGNRHEDDIYLWCEVDTESPDVVNKFFLIPTGSEIVPDTEYVGTLWLMNGSFVLHMYKE